MHVVPPSLPSLECWLFPFSPPVLAEPLLIICAHLLPPWWQIQRPFIFDEGPLPPPWLVSGVSCCPGLSLASTAGPSGSIWALLCSLSSLSRGCRLDPHTDARGSCSETSSSGCPLNLKRIHPAVCVTSHLGYKTGMSHKYGPSGVLPPQTSSSLRLLYLSKMAPSAAQQQFGQNRRPTGLPPLPHTHHLSSQSNQNNPETAMRPLLTVSPGFPSSLELKPGSSLRPQLWVTWPLPSFLAISTLPSLPVPVSTLLSLTGQAVSCL